MTNRRTSHADCNHPATPAARRVCREARSTDQLRHIIDTLTANHDDWLTPGCRRFAEGHDAGHRNDDGIWVSEGHTSHMDCARALLTRIELDAATGNPYALRMDNLQHQVMYAFA